MKKIAATLFAGAAAAAMLAAPAAAENLSFYNHASNWEAFLAGEYPDTTWTCEKTEVDNGMSAVDSDADIVVVKGGNVIPAWGPEVTQAPVNPRSGKPYGISWYMECNSDDWPDDDPYDPYDPYEGS